jgi:TRAP-type C4-dicarboxylate transport system permease small subunit
LTRLFTCVVLGLFTWGSGQFVYYEYVDNAIAFGGVPAWICEIIMPIGGGVMALRYLLLTFKS